jgi:hypothetical protein
MFSGCHVQYLYLRQKNQNDVFVSEKNFLHPTGSQYCLKIFHYSLLGMGEGVGREGTLSQVLASFLLPAKKCLIDIPNSSSLLKLFSFW